MSLTDDSNNYNRSVADRQTDRWIEIKMTHTYIHTG